MYYYYQHSARLSMSGNFTSAVRLLLLYICEGILPRQWNQPVDTSVSGSCLGCCITFIVLLNSTFFSCDNIPLTDASGVGTGYKQ